MRLETFLSIVIISWAAQAQAQTLSSPSQESAQKLTVEDVVELARKSSDHLKSIEQSLASLKSEILSRDLELSTTLESELEVYRDQKVSLTSKAVGETSGRVEVTLSKPFSSGTTLTMMAGHELLNSSAYQDGRNIADWELKLSQSLWRNAFGRGTHLRYEAERAELLAEGARAQNERQSILVSVENAFWDLLFGLQEEKIRKRTLERSLSLEKWLQKRMGQYAAEPTDLLQVQALVSQRRLDLVNTRDAIESAVNQLKKLIPESQPETWVLDLDSYETARSPDTLLVGSSTSQNRSSIAATRLDALAARYRVQQVSALMQQSTDQLRPDLDLFASYGTNGINPRMGASWGDAFALSSPEVRVGLNLSVQLSGSLKDEKRRSLTLARDSELSRSEALARESQVSWENLERRLSNLRSRITEARKLSDLQQKKVTLERRRYEQGRTTALQLTTFEVDASEAELRLLTLLAEQRKTEAQFRMFMIENGKAR